MSKKNSIVLFIFLAIFSTYLIWVHQIRQNEEKQIEQIILNYVTLIQEKRYSGVAEIAFFKDENAWLLEELPYMWEPFEIITIGSIQLERIENELYSSAIDVYVLIESENIYYTLNVDPYIAKINGEWKIIINPRDIPSNFSYSPELPDGAIDLNEIQLLD